MRRESMKQTYLDHAATTPCYPEVVDEVTRQLLNNFGNPSSLHSLGVSARATLDSARASVAADLGCDSSEIVFTSGGSESNNLALRGTAHAHQYAGRHIVTTAFEHESVLKTCEALQAEGFEISLAPVNGKGIVQLDELLRLLRPDTILVSVMHANNEVGAIQPIAEITRAVKKFRPDIFIHTDAVQTVGHVPVDIRELGVDLLTLTAHKFGGPKGIGALYTRRGVRIEHQIAGGHQEHNLRSGTESVALAAGMATALRLSMRDQDQRAAAWRKMRDSLLAAILSAVSDARVNGDYIDRLPTNLNISFLGVSGEDMVLRLDRRGIQASSGSACGAGHGALSHVLAAMNVPRAWAKGALRLTLGEGCRDMDQSYVVEQIKAVVAELRSTSSFRSNGLLLTHQ